MAFGCRTMNAFSIMKFTSKGTKCKLNYYDSVKNINKFIHVYFYEARNSMQFRSPNATLDRCCQTMCIVTSRWSHMSHIVLTHHSIEWCGGVFHSIVVFTQSRYYVKQINVLSILDVSSTHGLLS